MRFSVGYSCLTMPKHHIMRYKHLEVSPVSCIIWLCLLCFKEFFFFKLCCYPDVNACWTSLYEHAGHASSVHTVLCPPPPHSAQTRLCSALCWISVLPLFGFPKEASKRQKLIVFLFLGQRKKNCSVWIYSQHFPHYLVVLKSEKYTSCK